MRPSGAWFGRLAMAGACLSWAGCGGGDVPDPDSDSKAASAESARPVNRAGASAPEVEEAAKPGPTAVASNPPVAEPDKPADAEKPAPPSTKGDSSGTDEMLRMGATPSNPATPPADSAPGAAPPAATPPAATPPGGSAPGGSAPGFGPNSPPPGYAPNMPNNRGREQQGGGPPAMGMNGPQMNGRQNMNRPGGAGGPPGGPQGPMGAGGFGMPAPGAPGGGTSGTTAALPPASYRLPNTAVAAFLAALKAKNKDRLAEATADRAPTEAEEKHQKIFAAIKEQSISDDELDEMAKALDGYQVASMLDAKSSRRVGVIVSKMSKGSMLQRTIMTRQERDGWKVLDIENAYEFKMGNVGTGTGRKRSGR